ncbi:1-acyl-sn-glycerol-3-phosphate acyltransferase [Reichenbachiella versicolor]|uniref:1-acyl-sn-glycerol-3-phosphate acyltransferase n=1 Tax=Reichenbachiella versicolor TaxID=1821036 RepID=UPI000D6E17D3|nr:1-acyl-sn-glycerol-3-phosphate acyltransferase [Reichenbachiella versicolor]
MGVIQRIWYFSFWFFVRTALMIYYREIKISGKENLKKNAPMIWGANHENALIDPLIMTTRFPLSIHYLVRADVFNNPIVRAFLNSLNLMPVYRMSDGVNSVKANEKIFDNCFKIFAKGEHLILFPEATHDDRRLVKRAKKGISRIAIGAMNYKDAPDELYIIPTGMNYSRHQYFRSSVHIMFGTPIKVEKQEMTSENIDKIKDLYDAGLQEVSVALPRKDFEVYNSIFFHDQNPGEVLDPVDINTKASEISQYISEEQKEQVLKKTKELEKAGVKFPFEAKSNYWKHALLAIILSPFAFVGFLSNLPALLAGNILMKGFKDKVWKDTIHFAIGMVLVPTFWLVLFFIVKGLSDVWWIGGGVVLFSLVCLILMKIVTRHWRVFTSNRKVFGNPELKKKYEEFINLIAQFRA